MQQYTYTHTCVCVLNLFEKKGRLNKKLQRTTNTMMSIKKCVEN